MLWRRMLCVCVCLCLGEWRLMLQGDSAPEKEDWDGMATAKKSAELSNYPKPGESLHGFTLQRSQHFSELELSALQFKHDKTGADYLHVARDDQNNAFNIGFKTNPPDATGVPHILEHTTLCGSEKYPVRDPFFKMMPRSLQNFMNAFTSSDHTYYPFATTNAQDFKNLMGVYVDATLHPLLKRSDFAQEGWRIGPENPAAPAKDENGSDLVFKGVVYNEMKGQLSDASYLFYVRYLRHINPDINNSGGDPREMTNLTYEQLKKFHAEHYHPSNSKIFTYGDQPVESHLRFLGEQLSKFEKREVDQDLKNPITINGPMYVTEQGPVDPLTPPNAQYKTSTTWVTVDTSDIVETFAFQAALNILMDGYGSPLFEALIQSGLGNNFSPNTGADTQGTKIVFSVGLDGVKQENVPKVREAIFTTIKEQVAKGLEKHKVDALLHQMELGLKHKTARFGLGVVQRLATTWFNGRDPFESMAYNALVDAFKVKYAQPGYLEGLLEKYLLTDNTLTFTMEPSTSYADDVAAEEANRLKEKIAEAVKSYPSAQEAYKQLRERELELVKEQDDGRNQPLDSLPTLHASDISRRAKPVDTRESTVDNVKIQWVNKPTNGLTYFRALSLFEDLPDELRMLVPLFCDTLMRIGTKNKTMGEIEDEIKAKTGGISFGTHVTTSPYDTQAYEQGLGLTGFAFDRNIPAMFELLQTVLLETDFDSPNAHKMIRQLLQTDASGAVDGVASSGHRYAMKYSTSALSTKSFIDEQFGGLTQVKLITQLAAAEEKPEEMQQLINKLKTIQALAVTNVQNGGLRVALTCGTDAASSNEAALQSFINTVSASSISTPSSSLLSGSITTTPPQRSRKTLFDLPYQVSYSALAVPTGPFTAQWTAPISILAQLLTHKHLHHEIREKGGAYGGGALSRGLEGSFLMYSYRDPNPDNTLNIYNETMRWAAEKEWTERDLEEAKLSVFQALDAPQSINEEGLSQFLQGITQDLDQQRREWLLDTTVAQVKDAAESLAEKVRHESYTTILGKKEGKKFVEEEVGWEIQHMGLVPVEA
ncbi:uncharacterized protein MYCFIDRAFT_204362 [Pseudocercospora fijiensis CIRAD86]|uniref:Presequence protease, mitochondrial n=1 Tax=Pseudocercospora fijiensis (strain CIRAD86) TaxID=383855 RepID=M2ZLD0_PSEFD|nr:uncharacterized protein MYCFIDRAFT_204362 [Pseudocercospora fijiensis CIRAD86]EME79874.1 hypothetical protein MYCFIDRAFT_204362 [Pseudocercospora fijiensis CIRAD86]